MAQISNFQLDIQTKILRATFLTNMTVFKKHMPEIFNFYQNYKPSRAKLTFDHHGEINMVSEGALVYSEYAKENSYKQAEKFFEEPRVFSYHLNRSGKKSKFEHERVLDEIYLRREADIEKSNFNLLKHEKQIDFLTMIGVGLGFHIERLFQLCDVRFFYLYEPDPDCFFCAMHCIDFGPLIERCFSKGGAFTIKLGGNENQYVNGLNLMFAEQGFFNVARFFNYRHYRSEATDKTFKRIFDLAYRFSSGWGFFEDEIISIIHTLTNAEEQYPYIVDKALFDNTIADKPVFIIGNGPSLDETIEFVKNNADNAVIFSCGTALKTILDAGIMPDFHIEMERTAALFDWIDAIGHKDKLKQINIISLNTVYTEILKLFKNAYLLSKPKDGGMDFLYEFIDVKKYPAVDACNPTVTNAATAAAVYLGFKTMYLFGVDYGYIDEEHHHSKGSIYYQKGSLAQKDKMKSDMTIPGNFVDEVFTTQHFDNSRAALEILLEKNPDVTCYNCSNGANIQLTKPLRYGEIRALAVIDEKEISLNNLLDNAFSFEEMKNLDLSALFKDKLAELKACIHNLISVTSVDISSRLELAQFFSTQYKYVRTFKAQRETKILYRFLQGTINYYQSNIMSNAYCYTDHEKQMEFIRYSLGLYHEHLLWLFNEVEQSYNKPSKI
ncbi:MAG: motility associated factor glycosyltransferase family protein [Alteromonadaceae bacterium]|nr:motility associated factor glycosyltransferase family protein [Alteromonadaceae bacterium]